MEVTSAGRTSAGRSRWGRLKTAGRRSTARRGSITLGMQRVLAVRLVRTAHGPVADAIGVLHHRPVVQRIPMATAAALAARGVPVKAPPEAQRHDVVATPEGG